MEDLERYASTETGHRGRWQDQYGWVAHHQAQLSLEGERVQKAVDELLRDGAADDQRLCIEVANLPHEVDPLADERGQSQSLGTACAVHAEKTRSRGVVTMEEMASCTVGDRQGEQVHGGCREVNHLLQAEVAVVR